MSNYNYYAQNGGYAQDGSYASNGSEYPQDGGYAQGGGYALNGLNQAMLNPGYPPASGLDSLALGGGHGDDQELDASLFWQSGGGIQPGSDPTHPSVPSPSQGLMMSPPARASPPLPAPQAVYDPGFAYNPDHSVRHVGPPPPPPEQQPTQPVRYREPLRETTRTQQAQLPEAEPGGGQHDIPMFADDGDDVDIAALAKSMNLNDEDDAEDDDEDDDGTFNVTGPSEDGTRKRVNSTRREVRVGIRAMRHLKPHIQSYGKKGKTWKKTWKLARRAGCFLEASQAVFQRRMEEVLKAHTDWDSAPAWLKSMGHDVIVDTGSQIENIKGEIDRVRHDTEEQKEKTRQKHIEDEVGGDELRRESMRTARRKRPAPSDGGEGVDDQENRPPMKRRKRGSAADAAIAEDLGEIKEYAKEMAEASRDAAETYKEALESVIRSLKDAGGQQGPENGGSSPA
ncbi:hypothetical protein K523DRAFT_422315 [Schizophyllum commune Tattone D]|nr:hypothetical protein K523DRAFT_422315 [Schizophyllum commune Tattone D]